MSTQARTPSPRRIVVVGNGIAGLTAADTLRAMGFDGDLTLVGDEVHAPYSRPALSKALLRDPSDVDSHLLPPPTHGAVELTGVRAVGLDVEGRRVLLDGAEPLPYDGLVIASGCRARRLGTADQLTLRTVEDALQLRERVSAQPRVAVIGGGPLGMEIASGALETGCDVTLVSHGAPLGRQLGRHLSGVFVAAALARGLRVMTAAAVALEPSGAGTRLLLADGTTVDVDLVVTAVGDAPNVEWLADTGLLRDGVLEADGSGRVRPGIVAAGDVAAVPTPFGVRRVPLWSSAIEQAKAAATALLTGADAPAHPLPYFWTEQFGLSLKAVGHLPFDGEPALVDGDPEDRRALLRWDGAAAAINYRIPIPRLRGLCDPAA